MGCQECSGRGIEAMTRCPKHYSRTAGLTATLTAWSYLKAHGQLPVAGGTMEQAATFLEAVRILNCAQSAHQNRETKRG